MLLSDVAQVPLMTALVASAVPLLKEFGGQEPRRVSVEHRRTPSNTVS
jgi:hypothetical protein